ncbi:MAG TPA: glycerophosphodiester phosphodiesterase [Acidimicrobiales bacterium]|nr:glycerophosphodiester phosphodiesterase [Acidimicrobiales bacterium]
MLVIGHRGSPPAPENSIAGIHRAADLGADAVELDLRATRQGEVVLEHDAVPLRTSWLPVPVGWLGTGLATRVPMRGGGRRATLVAALEACAERELLPVLDLKEPGVAGPVGRALEEAGPSDAVVWSSHADALVELGRVAPGHRRALLDGHPPRDPDRQIVEAAELGVEGVNLPVPRLDAARAAAAAAAGLELWSGVGSLAELDALAELLTQGIELAGFTTDHAAEARRAVDRSPRD